MTPRILRILAALFLALALVGPARPVTAVTPPDHASTAMEIIALVNQLRASHGLAPYQVDAGVMAYAQQHSEYQASIHLSTHTHSDGSNSMADGMRENVATGMLGYMTAQFAVFDVWSDPIHMDPMIGYASGFVGAGVADDGEDVYYTLNVRPGGGAVVGPPGRRTPGAGVTGTPGTPTPWIPIEPLTTVTPRADGWNVHTVGYGQTLWAIAQAYGVPVDMIRAWNSMPADSNEIYAGQKLIIRAGPGTAEAAQAAATAQAAQTGAVSATATALTMNPAAFQVSTQAAPPEPAARSSTLDLALSVPATGISETAPAPTGTPPPAESPTSGPLAAGLLILIGGTLLVVLAFTMVKRG